MTVKTEKLWRCPRDGKLYPKPDQCALRCWAVKRSLDALGNIKRHAPVTRVTTIEVREGHDG